MIVDNLKKVFQEKFSNSPLIVRSPGRVNIIGEHTDYNEGFVLPAAINKAIYVAVSKRTDDFIHLYSIDYQQLVEVRMADLQPTQNWSTYILGVVHQLNVRGYALGGFHLVIDGDIPIGAGLSSSAAVECAVVYALNELFALGISKLEMVQIAQKAEHTYAGVMCGIMDQFASMFGKKEHVIKLDCRSLAYEYKPLKLDGYSLVLFNTNVKHSLASSAYNERRQQCEQGVAWVKEKHPDVHSLRDVTMDMLLQFVLPKDTLIYTRCKYVVEEIQRLQTACSHLENGDIIALGKAMFATHEGLSKEYDVSCSELDYLVNAVKNNPLVLGARMMGGGFGGCTINLIKNEAIESMVTNVSLQYNQATNLTLTTYVVETSDGTGIVNH